MASFGLTVKRRKDGVLLLSVSPSEAAILLSVPDRLEELLGRPDFRDRVVCRLFPVAYHDADKEAEYRRLLGDDLRASKLRTVEAFRQALSSRTRRRRRFDFEIPADAFGTWLACLNDMRLVLATELDITQENWGLDFDPDGPRAYETALLHYLSWLQEELLAADREA